jgi:hypothetical protein
MTTSSRHNNRADSYVIRNMPSLTSLPLELHLAIFIYLDPQSFLKFASTNRLFRELRKVNSALCRKNYLAIENSRGHIEWRQRVKWDMLCYGCFQLLSYKDKNMHYLIDEYSDFAEWGARTYERLCIPCDEKHGGVYLAKLVLDWKGYLNILFVVAVVHRGDPEEIESLKTSQRMRKTLKHWERSTTDKRYSQVEDVTNWDTETFHGALQNVMNSWPGGKRIQTCVVCKGRCRCEQAPSG